MVSKYILPQELTRPPIEEAVFEIRFRPTNDPASRGVPAVLRDALGAAYPRSEVIPRAPAPEQFRSAPLTPRYEPTYRLTGDGGFVLIGDGAVRLRLVGAYPGWAAVRGRIDALLDALLASKVTGDIERISLKFVNVLRDPPPRQLEALRVDFRVNDEAVRESGLHVRLELADERYVRVVEIEPGATGPVIEGRESAHGLMLALDCRRDVEGLDFWAQRDDMLESLHFELRALFFRLLTRESIERLGPIYRSPPEPEDPAPRA